MGSGKCNKGLEAKSTGDIQRGCIAFLNHANQPVIAPLLEGNLERTPEKGPAQRSVGGDVEHAALVLVVVVAHRCDDLSVLALLGDAAEIFDPYQSRALGNPSVDFPVPEDQISSQPRSTGSRRRSPAYQPW